MNAQNTAEVKNEEDKVVTISQEKDTTVNTNESLTTNEDRVLLISEEELRASIAGTASDIRTYFNKERNVDNIKLLFPKMNKATKA